MAKTARTRSSSSFSAETRLGVMEAIEACKAKKATDVALLELDPDSGAFTDYFVICSGSNPRQIQAISDDVEQRLSKAGMRPNNVEGYKQAEWVLLDYVDFVVHIFTEDARSFYDLERLWKSAKRVNPQELSAPRKSVKRTTATKPARATSPSATRKRTKTAGASSASRGGRAKSSPKKRK